MFRVRRNQDVGADVYTGSSPLLERDDGESIEEVIQDLFPLIRRLRGDAIPDLGRGREDIAVITYLRKSTQTAYDGCRRERLEVAAVYLCGEASSS